MGPRVQRLGYIAMNVVELEACADDACTIMGLATVERSNDRVLLTSNTRRAEWILHRATENRFRSIGLEAVDAQAVGEAEERAERAGLAILARRPSLDCIERAVTFATSEGHVFEVHTPMPRDQKQRHNGPGIHPRCVDHVNLAAADPQQTCRELTDALGLRTSDMTTGHEITWLRAADGRHHTVGVIKGRSGMHHVSWEFAEFSDFRRLGDILDASDRCIVWGPGRHGAGDNIFAYYVDAGGFLIECTAEMEIIDDPGFQPRIVDPGENLSNYRLVNRWGQLPPARWLQHHDDFAAPRAAA